MSVQNKRDGVLERRRLQNRMAQRRFRQIRQLWNNLFNLSGK